MMWSNVFCISLVFLSVLWIFVNSDICDEPKKVGPCRAHKPRFYFNGATGQCERFYWGGCSPNRNNFLTESECIAACSGQTGTVNEFYRSLGQMTSVCDRPRRIGPCRLRIPRYYYNRSRDECELFYWGGCMSNGNNFRSLYECHGACHYRG